MNTVTLIPTYNEENQIGKLLDRFPRSITDILVIDDGSTDRTPAEIQARSISVLRHPERTGVGKCLQDGIAQAKDKGYDRIVVMAGNGKDDPQEIPKLLEALDAGADYVQGSRFLSGGEWNNLPWKRWLAIKLFTVLWSLCLRRRLTDVTNGFRAYRFSFLNHPEVLWQQEWLRTYELEYYLHYKVLALRLRFTEVPVTKNYPTVKKYSKIRPGRDWLNIIRPLFLLMTGIKK